MSFADFYLNKYSNQKQLITQNPDPNLGFIIVIPCYNESQLLRSIESLASCAKPSKAVEVIIVVNAGENVSTEISIINKKSIAQIVSWNTNNENHFLKVHLIDILLPVKDAGVGLARKIGMDEAVRRFNFLGNKKGVIVGFDADSTCEQNYLVELEKLFVLHPDAVGCSIHYEHPIEGTEHSSAIYQFIQLYEIYLRYYIEALRYAHFPFAFHTLGSSFAVNVYTYCAQGGMNKRKAGEDFYFLHKILPLGEYYELTTTSVYPSPRTSDRVPFGTGAAIGKMLSTNDYDYLTFHPDAFNDLKILFGKTDAFYKISEAAILSELNKLPVLIRTFLLEAKAPFAISNANENSSSLKIFRKRFFQWMNGLLVLQYLNYAHQSYYTRIPVLEAANRFLFSEKIIDSEMGCKELLLFLREKQRRGMKNES